MYTQMYVLLPAVSKTAEPLARCAAMAGPAFEADAAVPSSMDEQAEVDGPARRHLAPTSFWRRPRSGVEKKAAFSPTRPSVRGASRLWGTSVPSDGLRLFHA